MITGMTRQERYDKFTQDMNDYNRDVEEYNGRNLYHGPAVRIKADELQDILRETEIPLQWDELGYNGLIVYPK